MGVVLRIMNFGWPHLVFLWRPVQECQSVTDWHGETKTIITTENKLWLCFALEYTLADGSKYYVRWKRVPRQRCAACGQVIK